MQRNLVYVVVALLVLVGLSMVLSFTAGGVMFGLGCFAAALALWLLYRGVKALELSADLQAQSLLQRNKPARDYVKGENRTETTAGRSEAVREEPRPSQPVAAGD
jgi:multisubunit Na+/H+ antiporter MnhC subunit